MKRNRRFFSVSLLKSFLLYAFIFFLARLIFNDDLHFLSTGNVFYILITALILSVLNAVRKSQDFKSIDEDMIDDLKERGLKFYLGFFRFLFLIVILLSSLIFGLGLLTYYLFFGSFEWDWNLLWKAILFALVLSLLLSVYSFISDRWKIASYYKAKHY